jgi:hypothetical protein
LASLAQRMAVVRGAVPGVDSAGVAGCPEKNAHRSAITGRFVTAATAARHPRTTVTTNG